MCPRIPMSYCCRVTSCIGSLGVKFKSYLNVVKNHTFSSVTTKRYVVRVVDRSNYTFSSVTTKRYVVMVVDRSNYTFFWIVITRRICCMLVWFSTTSKQLLNLIPVQTRVQTIMWTPDFLFRMWPGSNLKHWSLDLYQHNEII